MKSPGAVLPFYLYHNDAGAFSLNGAIGSALYTYFDGNSYSDHLSFRGFAQTAAPDDDVNQIGYDFGYVYQVVNAAPEQFWFLFSSFPFQLGSQPGVTHYRLYTSVDGQSWQRWKTTSGTTRAATTPPPSTVPPGPTPPNTTSSIPQSRLDEMRKALEDFLNGAHIAQGNEGEVSVEQFDFTGGKINFKIKAHHSQKWGPGLYAYQVDTYFQGSYDPFDSSSVANFQLCVALPSQAGGGQACVNLGDIAALLMA